MTCRINIDWHIYTCKEIRLIEKPLKESWRIRNQSDKIERDKRYEEFCMQIDNFLNQCECEKIPSKCEYCPNEYQEYNIAGVYFCKCVGRNIKLAKQLRVEGHSPWSKNEL